MTPAIPAPTPTCQNTEMNDNTSYSYLCRDREARKGSPLMSQLTLSMVIHNHHPAIAAAMITHAHVSCSKPLPFFRSGI
jgi:hypothetical protein